MQFFSEIKYLLSHIPRKLLTRLTLLIPVLGVAGMLEIISLAALIPMINTVLSHDSRVIAWLGLQAWSKEQQLLILFGLYMVVLAVKSGVVYSSYRYCFSTALQIKASVQQKLFSYYVRYSIFDARPTDSALMIRNLFTEANQLEGRLIMPAIMLLAELVPVLLILAFLCYLNPLGILIAGTVFVLTTVVIAKATAKKLKALGHSQIQYDGTQIKLAKESFSLLTEIYLHKVYRPLQQRYTDACDHSVSCIVSALSLGQLPKIVFDVVGILIIANIAYVDYLRGATLEQIALNLVVFVGAMVKILPSVNRIVMNIQSLNHAVPSVINMNQELRNLKPKATVAAMPAARSSQDSRKVGQIKFDSVTLAYQDKVVLEDVNFCWQKGDIIGIQGETGSGKSTLVRAILGLLPPKAGRILIDGQDLAHCRADFSHQIGYVRQDVILFDDDVFANVDFYRGLDPATIKQVLADLRLNESTVDLHSAVGDGAKNISGGQKQRVSIARALAAGPEVLILDEATSALDNLTEEIVNQVIRDFAKDRMVIIIAHKDSSLAICNKIYRVSEGAVVA